MTLKTLNNAQKTASSSSAKTILGKTFAGSPVNACSVEPESVLKNSNFLNMSIFHAPVIRRDSIPYLFQRFILILKVCILENSIVSIFKKCRYFWLASLFCLIWTSYIKLCVVCLALFFVLPSKLYCDIIKATQPYLEHKEVRHRHSIFPSQRALQSKVQRCGTL